MIHNQDMMKNISFDEKCFEQLKKEYRKAVEEGKESFIFDDKHELVTDYAKYLIEYLSYKFDNKTNENDTRNRSNNKNDI
jgi:hypothetical protein